METNKTYEYIPTVPVHPFEILEDEIAARGLTKKEFAESIGMKPSNFNRMMKRKGTLTSEMALKLEKALGIPFSHWMEYHEEYLKDCFRLNPCAFVETTTEKSSRLSDSTIYEDLYQKIATAINYIKQRKDNSNATDNLSMEQINSLENDFHRLGKELCELRLS